MVLKPRLIKKHSAKCSFLGPVLGCPVPPLPPWNPLLPAISFGSSLGNDNIPVYHLSSLSRVKLQNDISFLLISPKGKQRIIQEFCVKSEHLIRLICKLFTFSVCAAMRPYRSHRSSLWLWNASLSLFTCVLGSSLRFTWLLKGYLSCSSSSGCKMNHGFREIIAVSAMLERWHG